MQPVPVPTEPPIPTPTDACERSRVEHTRARRLMVLGQHRDIVLARLRAVIGTARADRMGEPDLSSNVLVGSASGLATLYDPDENGESTPTLRHPDEQAAAAMAAILDDGGIWPIMPRVQRDTLALREMLVRIDTVLDDDGLPHLSFRPVSPDVVEVTPHPRDPTRPIAIGEWRRRDAQWTKEIWSIAGEPRHAIVDPSGRDLSAEYGLPKGGLVGEEYPARSVVTGRPVLPYVVYHAALGTGAVFDPYTWVEIVDGQLSCSVNWSLFSHCLRNAAWAQRWAIGAEIAGATMGPDGRTGAPGDPANVIHLSPEEGYDGQPQAGQWALTVDPEAFATSIGIHERRLYSMAGMDPADVQRISGDPRSGYALEVSVRSKERSALRFAPVFARPDAELVTVAAILYNRALGFEFVPERLWSVEHAVVRAIHARAQSGDGAHAQALAAIIAQVSQGLLPLAGAAVILQRSFALDERTALAMLSGADVLAARALAARGAAA
ncbi:MAG: hypothetical protein ABMA64_24445 [Myxococcota bacterium]